MALEFLELLLSTKTNSRKAELSQLSSEAERGGLSCSGHGKRNGEDHYTRQLTDWGTHYLSSPS